MLQVNSNQVLRVIEGGESTEFKGVFETWDPPAKPADFSGGSKGNSKVAGKMEQREIDIGALHRAKQKEESMPVLNGKLEIWRIENFEKVEWPEQMHGT